MEPCAQGTTPYFRVKFPRVGLDLCIDHACTNSGYLHQVTIEVALRRVLPKSRTYHLDHTTDLREPKRATGVDTVTRDAS